uniref:Uncharacterized protein n=1 Tax=Rhizophora mucronata TaxID=61149 RepID=A0A2P2P387_RHIMU
MHKRHDFQGLFLIRTGKYQWTERNAFMRITKIS